MKQIAKQLALGAAMVAVLPSLLSFFLRRLLMGPDRALEGSSQALACVPGLPGQYMRRAFLMCVLEECHASTTVEFGTLFSTTRARLGPRVYVGPRCHLGLAHLEADVLLAAGVHVPSGGHIHGGAETVGAFGDQPLDRQLVRIGKSAWIGSAAVVMADVGADTLVGAGAVVTAPLPAGVIAAGVPARVIRPRHEGADG